MNKKYMLVSKPSQLPIDERKPLTFTLARYDFSNAKPNDKPFLYLKNDKRINLSGLFYRFNSFNENDWKPYNFNDSKR